MNPRTRFVEESDKWTRYEVVLDVFEDVIAYGLITIPKGIGEDEQRPVVVCQHGLEGRPQDVIGEQSSQYYSAFATKLAERGIHYFRRPRIFIFSKTASELYSVRAIHNVRHYSRPLFLNISKL